MLIDPMGEVLALVVPVFEALNIAYYIGGSVASSTHGDRRQTNDVDIVADMQLDHVTGFVQSLREKFYVDEPMIRDAIKRKSNFNIIHFTTAYKVDVFVMQAQPYDREAARRRVREVVEGAPSVETYLAQVEDVVLAKLRWFKATGHTSEKQWRDITGVLKAQCFNLDLDYLQRWAKEIGVAPLLDKALDESGVVEITEETESNGDSD